VGTPWPRFLENDIYLYIGPWWAQKACPWRPTKMSIPVAILSSLGWGLCAIVFGLLPVWTTLLIIIINHEVSFSEIELLKSGAIMIFAITLTISVLVDYHLSRFRFQSRFGALMLNAFFPVTISLFGMLIHIITVTTANNSLNTLFVVWANVTIVIISVLFCVFQKIFLVYHENNRGVA
jgi:hypothetical protein